MAPTVAQWPPCRPHGDGTKSNTQAMSCAHKHLVSHHQGCCPNIHGSNSIPGPYLQPRRQKRGREGTSFPTAVQSQGPQPPSHPNPPLLLSSKGKIPVAHDHPTEVMLKSCGPPADELTLNSEQTWESSALWHIMHMHGLGMEQIRSRTDATAGKTACSAIHYYHSCRKQHVLHYPRRGRPRRQPLAGDTQNRTASSSRQSSAPATRLIPRCRRPLSSAHQGPPPYPAADARRSGVRARHHHFMGLGEQTEPPCCHRHWSLPGLHQ